MVKRWKLVLLGTLVSLLTFLASANAASACAALWYQPELPKKLAN